MSWLLVIYIAGATYSLNEAIPMQTAQECVAIASQKLRLFQREYPGPIEAVSILCMPSKGHI